MGAIEGARVMPWADWSEWVELKQMLENGETERACERVAMYQVRRRNAVPLAVLTTVALVKLLENPANDSYSQRLALSMALTRFVNGTTDRLQPRGQGASARSVYGLAVELRLPLILVEIRHQASHNVLPRLSALTSGAKQALAWLENYYWVPQFKNIETSLENSFYSLRGVFGRDSDDEFLDSEHVKSGDQDKLEDGPLPAEDSSVLFALKETVMKMEAREKETGSEGLSNEATGNSPWTECTDYDSWRGLPIGLVPGQEQVPRFKLARSSKKRIRCKTRLNVPQSLAPVSCEPRGEQGDTNFASNILSNVPHVLGKHTRPLSTKEERYVQKKMKQLQEHAEAAAGNHTAET